MLRIISSFSSGVIGKADAAIWNCENAFIVIDHQNIPTDTKRKESNIHLQGWLSFVWARRGFDVVGPPFCDVLPSATVAPRPAAALTNLKHESRYCIDKCLESLNSINTSGY